MEIKRFLEKLSSNTPTPGGGSASALAGTLSASLILMTAGLSVNKGKLKEKEIVEIKKSVLRIQKRLFRAVEEDAKCYEAVLKAFRLPKGTERERLIRTKSIQKAFRGATITPQLVCRHSLQLLEYANVLILRGNPNAISDAGVAAHLADTALQGGLLNIGINLGPISDQSFRKKMHALAVKLKKRRNQIMGKIGKVLSRTLNI
jgi:formiminotetrahydrofolate cyclodeaminase